MKIGIIGNGYVGKAIYHGFKGNNQVATYDKYQDSTYESAEELCNFAKIVFVCVPTPMDPDGSCNISIVESVISEINEADNGNIAVIKSTVPPGTTNYLNKKYTNIEVVFSPEFLTEANYLDDFHNVDRIILGGSPEATREVKRVFKETYPDKRYIQTDSKTAEMIKYVANTFMATKVSYANEIYDICRASGVEYNEVIRYVTLDHRFGKSHWRVPGPDGKRGFGGSCFPKDISAFSRFIKDAGVNSTVLDAVWEKNLQVRPERDWEQLVGRAISKKELDNE
jgi:nucleotide sugar dehydrogenase